MDLLTANPRSPQVLECIGNLSREGFAQSSMTTFFQQRQVTNKFALAAMLLSEPMLQALRREVRRLGQGVRVEVDELRGVLETEVLKRDVFDGDDAKQAADFVRRANRAADRAKAKATGATASPASANPGDPPPLAPADSPT